MSGKGEGQGREGAQSLRQESRAGVLKQALQATLAVAVFGGVLAGLGLFLRWSVLQILSLERGTAQVIFAGLITLVTALVLKSLEQYVVPGLERRAKLAERRREVYEESIRLLFEVLWGSRTESGEVKEDVRNA